MTAKPKGIIVAIPGMFGNPDAWKEFRELFLQRGYHWCTARLRHHPEDPNALPPSQLGKTGLLDYVDDLETSVRKLTEKPILIGWSMGGLLALMLASRGLAKAAILLAPAPSANVTVWPWVFPMFHPTIFRSFQSNLTVMGWIPRWGCWNRAGKQTFKEFCYSMGRLLPPDLQLANFEKMPWESGRAAMQIGLRLKAGRVNLKDVRCPLLVVGGREDRLVPVAYTRELAKLYGADYLELRDCAHWIVAHPDAGKYCALWLEQALQKQGQEKL